MYKLNQNELEMFNNIINDIGDTLNYLRDLENQNISLSNELKKIKSDSSKLSDELIKFKDNISNIDINTSSNTFSKKTDIINKCTSFLKNKDRLISFMDFQKRFEEQYKKINKLKQKKDNTDDITYNESLLGFIFYKHKVDDYNIKQNYNSTCNSIVNLMDIEKLGALSGGSKQKFIKLINNISGKSINSTNTQIGGKNNVFDNLEDYITKIVDKVYKPRIHNDDSMFDKIKCNNNNTIIDNNNKSSILNNTDDDSQYIKRGFCRGEEKEEERKSFVYLNFKKEFNNIFTDIFIQKYLSKTKLLNNLCHYVYFALDFGIRQLLKSLNKKYSLKNDNKLNDSELYIIYKSGNTTNIILKRYMPKLQTSISDLDYYVSIDYENILKKINTNSANNKDEIYIDNYVEQTIIVVMHDIKNTISEHLHSTYQHDTKFAQELYDTYFKKDDMKNKIKNFIDLYNKKYGKSGKSGSRSLNKNNIDKIEITKIITYDTIITKDEQIKYADTFNNTMHKNGIVKSNIKYDKLMYIEGIKNFYNNIFLLEENINNNVYGIYIQNLKFVRPYGSDILGIYRLKINNKLEFTCDKQPKTINVPIELIDVSLCRNNSKLVKLKRFKENKSEDLIDTYTHNLDVTDMKIKMRMPSAKYMYMDLANILFLQNIYIWDDIKYKKRVMRLFKMIFVIYAKDNKTNECMKDIIKFINIINELQKKKDTVGKLNYLKQQYDPEYDIIQSQIESFSKVIFPKLKQNTINFYLNNIIEKHINHLIILNNLTNDDNSVVTPDIEYWNSIKENINQCANINGINIVNTLENLKNNIENDKSDSDNFEKLLLAESNEILKLCNEYKPPINTDTDYKLMY